MQSAVLIQHRPKATNVAPTSSVDAADMIRTYDVVADRAVHQKPYLPRAIGRKDDDVPILKTLLAAIAVPGHFPPVLIKGTPHSGVGSKYNNPTSQAFDEGARLYNMKAGEDRQRNDDKRVGIVVSIGSGKEALRDFLRPRDIYRRMLFSGKSTDKKLSEPDKVHNDMKGRLPAADIPYFRFDGPDLQKCKYDDWSPRTLEIIEKETSSYLAREIVKLRIYFLLLQPERWMQLAAIPYATTLGHMRRVHPLWQTILIRPRGELGDGVNLKIIPGGSIKAGR